jgi:O-phospho-L-seryl-tRNASec:L-selenocysteinyl-tRNA synthase
MSHGIGRSGNVAEFQPKAVGSSMLSALANSFALEALHIAGVPSCKAALVLPVATGMALTLCLSSWRSLRPRATTVLWCRIDQKSCFKCILTAGYLIECVEPHRDDASDALVTDVEKIEEHLRTDSERFLCVFTTTSCFAPRSPDRLPEVAKLCKEFSVPHLVNNAYGLQSDVCCSLLEKVNLFGKNFHAV